MNFLDKVNKKSEQSFRILTSPLRSLPDFLIIGVQKGGTTSLFNYMTQHPKIIPPSRKEVHYFDIYYKKQLLWYKSFFPLLSNLRLTEFSSKSITGEATPYYIYHPDVPRRVFKLIPNIKIIVLLRNPIERAYSHYYHSLRRKEENLPFDKAINQEEERLRGEESKLNNSIKYYSYHHQAHSYLDRGLYYKQLEKWFKYFPSENFLILKSEDFFQKPFQITNKVFNFLNMEEIDLKIEKVYNVGNYWDYCFDIDKSIKKDLISFYEEPNLKLLKLLTSKGFHWENW